MTSHVTPAMESIQRYMIVGMIMFGTVAFGIGGWATTTQLSGAVIAQGVVVVDSNVKKVQHATGGIVGELRVREGDRVNAGDVLIRLDETQTLANATIVTRASMNCWHGRLASKRSATAPSRSCFPRPCSTGPRRPRQAARSLPSRDCSTCFIRRGAPKSAVAGKEGAAGRREQGFYGPDRGQAEGDRSDPPRTGGRAHPLAKEPAGSTPSSVIPLVWKASAVSLRE